MIARYEARSDVIKEIDPQSGVLRSTYYVVHSDKRSVLRYANAHSRTCMDLVRSGVCLTADGYAPYLAEVRSRLGLTISDDLRQLRSD